LRIPLSCNFQFVGRSNCLAISSCIPASSNAFCSASP
jgi:hypothetical protein